MASVALPKSSNPLDASMTRTQVVRRKFKSSLPRKIENRQLSPMEALGRTFELFERLRNEMGAAGLDENNTQAGLIYCQPSTPGEERVLARTRVLPKPDKKEIAKFCDLVMGLDRPLFLGVVFLQIDPDADRTEQQNVIFVAQFISSPEANGRLLMARDQLAKGGFKSTAN